MKNVVLYLTPTMADWEYGYLAAGLAMADEAHPGAFTLLTASGDGESVLTKGRLRVQPDAALAGLDPAGISLLVLPGADTWAEGHVEALDLARRCLEHGVPVAAICGATLGLARSGLLNDRAHTSNAPEFLAGLPAYTGGRRYREAPTVVDAGLITAPATAPVDFARAVFETLEAFPPPVLDAWYGLYTTGEKKYFDQLA